MMTSRQLSLTGLLSKHVRPVLEPLGYQYLRAERTFVRTTLSGNWSALSFDPYRGRAGQYFIEAGAQSRAVAEWFSRFELIDEADRTAYSALCRWRLTPTGFGQHTWTVDASNPALDRLLTALTDVAAPRAEALLDDQRLLDFLEEGQRPPPWAPPSWLLLARGVLRLRLSPAADLTDLRESAQRLEQNDLMPAGLRTPFAALLG